MIALRLNSFRSATLLAVLAGLGVMARTAEVRAQAAECCVVPDQNGTALMPPNAGCLYLGTTEIVDGLPLGSSIQITATYGNFFGITESAGGSLSGTVSTFQAFLNMNMTGTGLYSSYSRFVSIPLSATQQISWGPRVPFAPVQTFAAQLEGLQGQITGDVDFDLLRITGGTLFGLPAPGQAQAVSVFGNWAVNGFFDLTHRIDFIGSSGGPFSGRSGSTTRERRFTLCPQNTIAVQPSTWSQIKLLMRP